MDIGERIREIRKDKKMTQRELAALTGVAENTIRQYELHLRRPKVEQLKSIARVFDCSLDYLTGADERLESIDFYLDKIFTLLGYTPISNNEQSCGCDTSMISVEDMAEVREKVISFIKFTLIDTPKVERGDLYEK